MIKYLVLLGLSFSVFSANYADDFPMGPVIELTPGSLCTRPTEYRYAERIPYCERNVDTHQKEGIFKEYRQLGYRLNPKDRKDYKIDHLIPLCAGGSNREDNLWPQHVSIYTQTDPLEGIGCEKLKSGRIKQSELVELILAAKKNLRLVPDTLSYLTRI
jgi:hypothetical protein